MFRAVVISCHIIFMFSLRHDHDSYLSSLSSHQWPMAPGFRRVQPQWPKLLPRLKMIKRHTPPGRQLRISRHLGVSSSSWGYPKRAWDSLFPWENPNLKWMRTRGTPISGKPPAIKRCHTMDMFGTFRKQFAGAGAVGDGFGNRMVIRRPTFQWLSAWQARLVHLCLRFTQSKKLPELGNLKIHSHVSHVSFI